ncbi:DUF1501 domain-containing protein [bacterium]|nr:DUF1501 domain-containing protein [bacterium]
MLREAACGFGSVAMAAFLAEQVRADKPAEHASLGGSLSSLHHPAKAKSVIFLYMDGGPSQLDTFDPKPRLEREHGQPIKLDKIPATQFDNVGTVLASPWKFSSHGESGIPVSSLFPNIALHVDRLAIIRSMTSNFSEHTSANYFLHTGSGLQGRPSMGAWTTYGLGTRCQNLPGYVVLDGGLVPRGGVDNFHSGFLPADYQGSIFKTGPAPVPHLSSPHADRSRQNRQLSLIKSLDASFVARHPHENEVEAAIANYELAYRMQAEVPDLVDIQGETKETLRGYGLEHEFEPTRVYGRICLIARRLVERGVRFIELTCPRLDADRWDQHANLKDGHERNARAIDQPIAFLLEDLHRRGLLDETLVVWAGEFGRTPMAQGSNGRDHNPFGFTIWMAGGGIKGGTIYGATDDYGYFAIEKKSTIHDMHATMLHLLGVDHKQLTYRFSSRDMRLTDVHGEVMKDILA